MLKSTSQFNFNIIMGQANRYLYDSWHYGVTERASEGILSYVELHFQARAILKKMKKGVWGATNVCLFGHTHKSKIWRMDVRGKVAPVEIPTDGFISLDSEEFYLLNPGGGGSSRIMSISTFSTA
ncbi:MAG: hypothetical protein V3S16_07935 [Candidatus Desulfatibia sp.]|uniref:hypothetical protein n=1 Tax=Candidatus Desulfatibia sp. TaxID=3101189 RepID=UPI002F2C1FCE